MQNIPLYFRFDHLVCGRGFLADVRLVGRATCTEEFGATWIYGVNPGALAESGGDLTAAYAGFRNRLVGVLFDLAEESGSFAEFHERARSFFEATDADSVSEWEEARQAIRAGNDPHGYPDLQREVQDLHPSVDIREVTPQAVSPELNYLSPDQPSQLAA